MNVCIHCKKVHLTVEHPRRDETRWEWIYFFKLSRVEWLILPRCVRSMSDLLLPCHAFTSFRSFHITRSSFPRIKKEKLFWEKSSLCSRVLVTPVSYEERNKRNKREWHRNDMTWRYVMLCYVLGKSEWVRWWLWIHKRNFISFHCL
jgi:hypothetical protein